MDTFFEQLVKVKRSGKDIAILFGIWAAAVLLIFLLYIVAGLSGGTFLPLCFAAMVGVIYGAVKLSGRTSVEYEYIFTNGDLDVDKITAKSSRKRMVSVKCASAERYGKYNPAARPSGSVSKTYLFCSADHPEARYMIVPHKNEGNVMIIFAPDERLRGVIEKAIPRIAM